jgi:hypothetical protein
MSNRIVACIAFIFLSFAAPAMAGSEEEHRSAFEKGWAALSNQDYATAEQIFSSLFKERPTYDVAIALGQAEFRLKKYRDAATHLAFGIRNAPPGIEQDTLERSKTGLQVIKQRYVGTVKLRVDPAGAEVRVDGASVGAAPLDGDVFVEPGKHVLEATRSGYASSKRDFQIIAGEELPVTLSLAPAPTAAAPSVAPTEPAAKPEPDAGSGGLAPRTVVLIGGTAVTLATATTAIVFALKASAADKRANDHLSQAGGACAPANDSTACQAARNDVAARNSDNKVANITGVVAVVAAVATGTVFFAWPADNPPTRATVRVEPVGTTNFGGVLLHGRF